MIAMQVDWIHFAPWTALGGGVLIGAAAAILLAVNGRILGVSGIVGGLLDARLSDIGWRAAFLCGVVASPLVFAAITAVVRPTIDAGYGLLAIAGLLVGLGTRLGSGCTSGHGICGVSRLSPRSLVATGAFMLAGFATVFFVRHALG